QFQHRVLELHGRGALATTGPGVLEGQVADLLALLDRGFLVVRGHHLRLRNGLATAFLLRGREFQVEQVVTAQDADRETTGSCGRRRQVDVEPGRNLHRAVAGRLSTEAVPVVGDTGFSGADAGTTVGIVDSAAVNLRML